MGDVKNLVDQAAVEKIKELAKAADIAILVTNLSNVPLSSRPMSTQDVDDDGNIWFISKNESHKNEDIINDSRVQLFYSNKSSSEYLSIYGNAEVLTDRDRIEELWSPIAKTWFNEGKDDPTLTLIRVVPSDAYYWDTKQNKLISLVKIAYGAITGTPTDGGVEGSLKI